MNESLHSNEGAFLEQVGACFRQNGPLAQATQNYVARQGQLEFALAVARAIEQRATVVAEAGTGTGKTFAYLTPALLAGCKVIVSTAGKPLQDQLFNKDIPALEQALGMHAQSALLKGRANYICRFRLARARQEGLFPTPQAVKDFKRIEIFAQTDISGDKANVPNVEENSPVWPLVTSTKENCLGKKCPDYDECFLYRARTLAKQADIVVVNHHLFLSAMSIGDGVDADMLPMPDLVIFDEAHKLPDIAGNFFGTEFASYSVKDLTREIKRQTMSRFRSLGKWDELADRVIYAMQDFVLKLDELGVSEDEDRLLSDVENIDQSIEPFDRAITAFNQLIEAVRPLASGDAEIEVLSTNAQLLSTQMQQWRQALTSARSQTQTPGGQPTVRWFSRMRSEIRFHETPISFAQDFAALREQQCTAAWVFASATLATGKGDFSHFIGELGLIEPQTYVWNSPFDYPNQAMLYVPPAMPDAKTTPREDYIDALVRESWPLIDLLKGRTLFLCTSYRAMRRAGEYLRALIEENHRDYHVYVHEEGNRTQLIEKFRKDDQSILIGTMSFWEGIDIKGDALSMVVIDKLPFAPQGTPVLEARCRWIEQQGRNAFREHQLPLAAIALKQGSGRLIRSEDDRGILLIGDCRIIPKRPASGYGALFLESLPPFSRTRRLDRVMNFWENPHTWQ